MNNSISRNKLSCTLDPRRPEGKELLLRLVEKSDVFIESLKMSSLHRMGIQEGELMDRNPRLVVLRIPPTGLDGDWCHYKGFGSQFDALSGFTWLSGHHDEEVVQAPPSTYMDAATGPAAAFAVLAALHYRDVTGRGQAIELAQLENVVGHLGDVLVDLQFGIPPRRVGNRHPEWAPQGLYRCKGEFRWLAISVTSDTEWVGLARIVGGRALAENSEYVDRESRMARHDELDAIISEWTSRRDVMEAFHFLQRSGIPAAPLLVDDLLERDDHVGQRGWVGPLPTRDAGTYPHIGRAISGIPQEWIRGAPALGEDNRYVYQGILGLDDDAYRRLMDLGIAVEDYLDADGRPV
jgi:crotonobetainyl-CoA:carnitine CoA-transferase CaiB-like acyl-CoA transferase